MRPLFFAVVTSLGIAGLASAQPGGLSYFIDNKELKVFRSEREKDGTHGLWVTVQFRIHRTNPDGTPGPVTIEVPREEIVVREDGKPVERLDISAPRVGSLTTVLAFDISGSMASNNKIGQAKHAAETFFDKMDANADVGLILFDHKMRTRRGPVRDRTRFGEHRDAIRGLVRGAEPMGGTAYLEATANAVRMLKSTEGTKAVVVMTDGVDMNSSCSLDDVINEARTLGVPVYTIGVGRPGRNDPVSTVLVLDHSGSMNGKANDTDQKTKIEALHDSGSRFIDLMRPGARVSLLPFSSEVELPSDFTANKAELKGKIEALKPAGGTLLYDATYAGIETVVAGGADGKRAVVVLTDGKDEAPGSRRSPELIVERAKEANVPVYMIGLGRKNEINRAVMQDIATRTGGKFFHAESEAELARVFEDLSIDLHDDGIDQESLKRLASETGGKYYPVSDISQLGFIYQSLATELQQTYTATYLSPNSRRDGTASGVEITVERGGRVLSNVAATGYNRHGLVPPEMNTLVYLGLLGILGLLLFLPSGVKRLFSKAAAP